MQINPHQFVASMIIAVVLLFLILRLVQKGRLDIAYSWLWLGIGLGIMLVVVKYEWLAKLSTVLGAKTHTTTLFMIAIIVTLLLCLQFTLIISSQRRQIKRLAQELAMIQQALEEKLKMKGTDVQQPPQMGQPGSNDAS